MNRLVLPLFLLCLMSGCERRTEVKVEGGNPPKFVLSGSGRLQVIFYGPEQELIAKSDPLTAKNGVRPCDLRFSITAFRIFHEPPTQLG